VSGAASTSVGGTGGGTVDLFDGRDVVPYPSIIGAGGGWVGIPLDDDGSAASKTVATAGDGDGVRVSWSSAGPRSSTCRHDGNGMDLWPNAATDGALVLDVVVPRRRVPASRSPPTACPVRSRTGEHRGVPRARSRSGRRTRSRSRARHRGAGRRQRQRPVLGRDGRDIRRDVQPHPWGGRCRSDPDATKCEQLRWSADHR